MAKTISDLIKDQMKKVPTNARLFGEYVAGKEEAITEKDFKPSELEAMSRSIIEQDDTNKKNEAELKKQLAYLNRRSQEPFDANKSQTWNEKNQKFAPKYKSTEYNKLIQRDINSVEKALSTYEKTRGKTSVSYGKAGGGGFGAGFLDAIGKSFASPAYNVETSLGHFNAHKNKDGTVTIKDKYDFLGVGFDKERKISMSEFIANLPSALTSPEQFGTLFARTFMPTRARAVKIKLPSLIKKQTKEKSKPKKSLLD
tara:strand:+ start:39 stop:806 length:768 start_codon:yes stop_codon:yes gene_type:complete